MEAIATKLRKIGNSRGVLLSRHFLNVLKVKDEDNVMIRTEGNRIIIEAEPKVNSKLMEWEEAFKNVSPEQKVLSKEEKDFMSFSNDFDEKEWTW